MPVIITSCEIGVGCTPRKYAPTRAGKCRRGLGWPHPPPCHVGDGVNPRREVVAHQRAAFDFSEDVGDQHIAFLQHVEYALIPVVAQAFGFGVSFVRAA